MDVSERRAALGDPERVSDENKTGNVRGGRPRRGEARRVPWREIEDAYIYGEVIGESASGREERRFVTLDELSKRYGVRKSLLGYYSKRGNWLKRRQRFQGEVVEEFNRTVVRAAALNLVDVVHLLDRFILKYAKALEEDRLPTPTVSDLAAAVKLKQSLSEALEAKESKSGDGPTLMELHRLHEESRRQRAIATATGVVAKSAPAEAQNVLPDSYESHNSPESDDGNSRG